MYITGCSRSFFNKITPSQLARFFSYFLPTKSMPMHRCQSYSPMNPLAGILHPRGNAPGYRYASPDGDGFPVTDSVTHSHTGHSSLITVHSSHTFSAKERDTETGLSYFGARYYSSDLSIWLSVDSMSGKYPSLSPYVYCADNPVKLVDPNGEDPIYAKNFWGNVKKIGDDGRCGSGSYLVRGRTARDVKSATKAGEFYMNDLSASNEVFHIPTGKKQKDVQTTVQNTINSGDSPDTRVEYGGHSIKGEENARLWDPGIPTQTYKTPDGYTVNERSITPFRINGVNNRFGGPPEAFEYIWHVHTFSSTPSSHDFFVMRNDWSRWFKGTIFIVCPNDNKVAFYNQSKVLIRVTYDEFKKMGKQEDIP